MPWLELQAAKLLFQRAKKKSSTESANAMLIEETEILKTHAETISPALAAQPVLIDRLPGLEDSSRYWSVYMTLEHLAIVNEGIAGVLRALCHDIVPPGVLSTADVKPHPEADAMVVTRFLSSVESLRAISTEMPNLETRLRYDHPWFGALNAAEWHFLAAFHQRLHRKQIEEIRKLLG